MNEKLGEIFVEFYSQKNGLEETCIFIFHRGILAGHVLEFCLRTYLRVKWSTPNTVQTGIISH